MKVRRPYTMRARADAADATRSRILAAAQEMLWEQLASEVTVEAIAFRAGVSAQSLFRIFGTRAALMEAATRLIRARLRAQRGSAPPGDLPGSVSALFDHYEEVGDLVVRALAEETLRSGVSPHLDEGRREHRRWVSAQCAPQLERHLRVDREAVFDAVAVVTDVYAWKLLRRDRELSRAAAEAVMVRMVRRVLEVDQGG